MISLRAILSSSSICFPPLYQNILTKVMTCKIIVRMTIIQKISFDLPCISIYLLLQWNYNWLGLFAPSNYSKILLSRFSKAIIKLITAIINVIFTSLLGFFFFCFIAFSFRFIWSFPWPWLNYITILVTRQHFFYFFIKKVSFSVILC